MCSSSSTGLALGWSQEATGSKSNKKVSHNVQDFYKSVSDFLKQVQSQFRFKAYREMIPLGGKTTKLHCKVMGIGKKKVSAIFVIYHVPFDHHFGTFSFESTDAAY